jgi:hypothetical protein
MPIVIEAGAKMGLLVAPLYDDFCTTPCLAFQLKKLKSHFTHIYNVLEQFY